MRIALVLVVLFGAAGSVLATPPEPIPHPDPASMAPAVREAVQRAIEDTGRSSGAARAQAYGTLGMLYHAHQLFDAARAAYENAARLAPGEWRWPYLRGFLEQQTGALTAAIESYGHALALAPDYTPGRVRLGQTLLEAGDTRAAQEAFERALAADPDNPAALAGLGNVALAERRFEAAVGHLEAALVADPAASQLRYPLALAYRQTGRLAEAKAQTALAGREAPALEDPVVESMIRMSRSAHYYVTEGFAASYEGRYRDAEAMFRRAIQADPADATAHAALGRVLELTRRFDEALAAYDAALARDGDHVMANYFRGALLEQRQEDAAARRHYRAALRVEPERREIRLLLGKSLLRAGEYGAAEAEFEILSSEPGDEVTSLYYLGLARLALNRCGEALAPLQRAVELGPLYTPALRALARVRSACPEARAPERALELARRLTQTAGDAGARETLAMALAAAGRFAEAQDIQETLVAARPDDGFVQRNLQRYRARQPADTAWPAGDPVFAPPRVSTYNR